MGLLDFARDVGRQIFHTDAEAADNIKQHLEIKMTGLTDLDVKFDDGVATLCGICNSEQTRETAILLAGNVKGVAKVVADKLIAPQPVPQEKKRSCELYVIENGDTLGKVAKRFYGKSSQYMRIFEANRELIADPDKIYPGQKIRIPLD
jgi:nucleoid-associated protein YgaU